MRITNTRESPRVEFLGDGSIERQEKQGQNELVESNQLPVEGLEHVRVALGIEILNFSEGDPLFCDVKLPEGWEVIPNIDHSMWSGLIDAEGEKKADIFYKAAFYDRKAFIRIAGR